MNIFHERYEYIHSRSGVSRRGENWGGKDSSSLGTPLLTFILFYYYSLSRNDKILLIFTNSVLFTSGILLGILCELLLKAISAGKLELYTYSI